MPDFSADASRLAQRYATETAKVAELLGADASTFVEAVVLEMRNIAGSAHDGRAKAWRVRCRLYSETTAFKDVEADSDPDLPADLPGATEIRSLTEVGKWARELALTYHGADYQGGLEDVRLSSKVKGLRVAMSTRGDGTATMRLQYVASGFQHIARVDVCSPDAAPETRRMPGT